LAEPDIVKAVSDADILVFVVPHEFVPRICAQILGKIKINAIAISLIKGITISADGSMKLISSVISDALHIRTAVLMGANLAHEVANENFCEATIGCKEPALKPVFKKLFETENFRITTVDDSDTVELCGALKVSVFMCRATHAHIEHCCLRRWLR
jgi:glycerol-3-phosphate dehydrogenase (NAD+)